MDSTIYIASYNFANLDHDYFYINEMNYDSLFTRISFAWKFETNKYEVIDRFIASSVRNRRMIRGEIDGIFDQKVYETISGPNQKKNTISFYVFSDSETTPIFFTTQFAT